MEHNMYVYYGSMFVYNVSVCCVIHSSSSSGRWDLLRNTQKRSGEPNAGKNDSTDSNYANGLLLAHHVLPFAPLSLTPSLSLSLHRHYGRRLLLLNHGTLITLFPFLQSDPILLLCFVWNFIYCALLKTRATTICKLESCF